jgi:hypothetical protein
MQQLHKAVGELPILVISSDACIGLTAAVRDVFPHAERRECFRHLVQNYIKQFAGQEHMYPAAWAYRADVYEHHVGNDGVHAWFKEWHSLLWYRSGFNPAIKCDYITNNIVEKLTRKILPPIINILRARTRGLGHLSFVKGDHYCAEVQGNNNVLTKHVVKADMQYCSCLEWQHTDKPCQHALVVIIAQPFRDVGLEHFVDDYFLVDKFKKVYARRIEQLGDQSLWPKVGIAKETGAPLAKRAVGRQRKNRIKSCLEGGSSKKSSNTETEKSKKQLRGRFKCPNCGEVGHRKNSPKCSLNGTKKR